MRTALPKPSEKLRVVTLPLFLIFFLERPGRQKQIHTTVEAKISHRGPPHPAIRIGRADLRLRKGNSIAHKSHRRGHQESVSGAWNWILPENRSTG
jgi:hypothetical protein